MRAMASLAELARGRRFGFPKPSPGASVARLAPIGPQRSDERRGLSASSRPAENRAAHRARHARPDLSRSTARTFPDPCVLSKNALCTHTLPKIDKNLFLGYFVGYFWRFVGLQRTNFGHDVSDFCRWRLGNRAGGLGSCRGEVGEGGRRGGGTGEGGGGSGGEGGAGAAGGRAAAGGGRAGEGRGRAGGRSGEPLLRSGRGGGGGEGGGWSERQSGGQKGPPGCVGARGARPQTRGRGRRRGGWWEAGRGGVSPRAGLRGVRPSGARRPNAAD